MSKNLKMSAVVAHSLILNKVMKIVEFSMINKVQIQVTSIALEQRYGATSREGTYTSHQTGILILLTENTNTQFVRWVSWDHH